MASSSLDATTAGAIHLQRGIDSIFSHSSDSLISSLEPGAQQRLDVLVCIADLLGIDDLSFSSYSSSITRTSVRYQGALQTLNRLELVERELQCHLTAVVQEERLIESWIERIGTEHATAESTATIQGRRETLLKKAKEYRAALDVIVAKVPRSPTDTFADLTAQQAANEEKAAAIKAKRAQIKAFKGLPPNLDLARQQLKTARAAQMDLIQTRERLLGRMAESIV
ncbi:hypothetical protein C8F04DRAFT_939110 [Mycena alexandri]|uniref:Uncharacterized protein n=1 Tax=Mycena alexandri TaxID=1745969 RepID=A0AAD6TH76_9AGAR|nr:hypothetical protein C8F04DRAFT_939110 [Mycena alexandri]